MPIESSKLVQSLFDHAAWANAAVLANLRAANPPPPQAVEQFAHVLGAERVWITRLQGIPQDSAVWPRLTLDECEALHRRNLSDFKILASGAADFEREVAYTNSAGVHFKNRVIDILLHIALHGSYHRGMTSYATRHGGGIPVPTDFIAFVRGAPTATRKDAERR